MGLLPCGQRVTNIYVEVVIIVFIMSLKRMPTQCDCAIERPNRE